MKGEEIQAIGFNAEIKPLTLAEISVQPGNSFESVLMEKAAEINHKLNAADTALQELAIGKSQNLHQTMITLENAKLSMKMLEQIRNRVLSAWQDLMREQI